MGHYRRLFVPERTYFFTVRLRSARSDFLVRHIELLRHAVRITQSQQPFVINAAVVLPSKLHMIWTMPPDDHGFSGRWRQIKSTFSRHIPAPCAQTPAMKGRGDKGVWQPRYWDHLIRDQEDYDLHDHLIATAPVRHGLVRKDGQWPYCSAVRQGTRSGNAQSPAA